MRTTQMQQRSLCNAHRQIVRMFAQLHHAQIDQQLANVQSRLKDAQRTQSRISLEHRIDGQQHNLIVQSTLPRNIERRSGCLRFIRSAVVNVRVRVRSQHLRNPKGSCRTSGGAQGVQLWVERTLPSHVVRWRGRRVLGHGDDWITSGRKGCPRAWRLGTANNARRFDVPVKSWSCWTQHMDGVKCDN